MGKNDFLTPKAIGNRIKSKGLQKLRWYCQMCGKQCRDENDFKCHLTSDSHKRQMMVFGEAPDRVIEGYSEEFEETFLEHLRQAHPSTRVSAKHINIIINHPYMHLLRSCSWVYNEFIADKHHVHMNSTNWLTLTDFVKSTRRSSNSGTTNRRSIGRAQGAAHGNAGGGHCQVIGQRTVEGRQSIWLDYEDFRELA